MSPQFGPERIDYDLECLSCMYKINELSEFCVPEYLKQIQRLMLIKIK